MTQEELNKVVENHGHWLREDCKDWNNMRADLRDADLRGADLRGAVLRGADLMGAVLMDAVLNDADLRDANLRGAVLNDADLRGANLRGAVLNDADLRGANLRGAANIPFIPYACPDFGMFIGFKKVYAQVVINGVICAKVDRQYIAVLEIPEDAKRLSATGRKCRCSKAKVLSIQNLDGTPVEDNIVFCSVNDPRFVYKVGVTVIPDSFDEDRWNKCSHGINFFINRQEAVNY